jgi:hypothetical protein
LQNLEHLNGKKGPSQVINVVEVSYPYCLSRWRLKTCDLWAFDYSQVSMICHEYNFGSQCVGGWVVHMTAMSTK